MLPSGFNFFTSEHCFDPVYFYFTVVRTRNVTTALFLNALLSAQRSSADCGRRCPAVLWDSRAGVTETFRSSVSNFPSPPFPSPAPGHHRSCWFQEPPVSDVLPKWDHAAFVPCVWLTSLSVPCPGFTMSSSVAGFPSSFKAEPPSVASDAGCHSSACLSKDYEFDPARGGRRRRRPGHGALVSRRS